MRNRSRMAPPARFAGLAPTFALALVLAPTPPARAGDPPVTNRVNLEIQINGLGPDGGKVEIKPGHAACRFKAVTRTIKPTDAADPLRLDTIAIDARSTGADRDCSFAITIHEPGKPPKTFRRGLRLTRRDPGQPTPVRTLRCNLTSPTLAAREGTGKVRK